ncbi:MAG: prolipoprotein diacylglyceryl transferase [Gammaproteobacteria bacterium]|nr:prolipoprotein diacylglyceryl transferase [Gammaproteobacteria bacterium]
MLTYPAIGPIAFHIGSCVRRWYGLMYLLGFACVWWLGSRRAARPGAPVTKAQVLDLVSYGALGAILGGRLGYILFYDLPGYLAAPLNVFKLWQGGMSFHGGLIGVLVAMWLYARHAKKGFFEISDFIAPLVPLGLAAGRAGNFINGELWGKVSDVPWAMVFPGGGPLARHPSQLYQALLEGLLLFIILWIYSSRPRPVMAVSAVFLIFYGLFRFLVEFVRVPDEQLGYLALDWLTMGQVLSLPMFLAGLALLWLSYRNRLIHKL